MSRTPFAHNPIPDYSHDLHRDLHRGNPHNVAFDPKHLHVITAVSNPFRYNSRYHIYKDFEKHVQDAGAQLWTVELQLRDRPFLVTDKRNPYHLQLRSDHVLWVKENLWNVMVGRLPDDAHYIMVADADIIFSRPDWAVEVIHMLQHYEVIQPWTESLDLGPNFESRERQTSFCYDYLQDLVQYPQGGSIDKPKIDVHNGKIDVHARRPGHGQKDASFVAGTRRHHHRHHHHHQDPHHDYPYYFPIEGKEEIRFRPYTYHPGYAWAWRRSALNKVGGFLDQAILGSADHHMALGLIGEAERTIHSKASKEYHEMVLQWQERARALNKNIGFMNGTIMHRWHGKKRDRNYRDRWKILIEHDYNPLKDIRYEANGVLALQPDKWKLKHDFDSYFLARNEDSIDVD